MNKNEFKKKAYFKPATEVYAFDGDSMILAGSPPVRPGGDGGGSVTITPPSEDEDEELEGTRKFSGNSLWE